MVAVVVDRLISVVDVSSALESEGRGVPLFPKPRQPVCSRVRQLVHLHCRCGQDCVRWVRKRVVATGLLHDGLHLVISSGGTCDKATRHAVVCTSVTPLRGPVIISSVAAVAVLRWRHSNTSYRTTLDTVRYRSRSGWERMEGDRYGRSSPRQPLVFEFLGVAIMEAVIDSVLRKFAVPLVWVSSRTNRMRLAGARVEIVPLVMSRKPEPCILLVQSHYENAWMPPQEGVNFGETLAAALMRGLWEECGLQVADENGLLLPTIYIRHIEYIDTLVLPRERWGERSVAGNVEDSFFSHIKMKKKAYWAAYVIVADSVTHSPTPNLNEIVEARWVPLDDVPGLLASNRPEKRAMLMDIIHRGIHQLVGSQRVID